MNRIGDPLVWKTSRHPEHGVVSHYKYDLSATDSFEKDEWGPWLERSVPMNDPETGEVRMMKVLRTDPKGVDLVKSFPSIHDDPGVEDWNDPSVWSSHRVFSDMHKWKFYGTNGEDTRYREEWDCLRDWHCSHPCATDIKIGDALPLTDDCIIQTSPPMSWSEMWDVIIKGTVRTPVTHGLEKPTQNVSHVGMSESHQTEEFLDPLSKRVDREKLASSVNIVELNRVTHGRYTKEQQRVALLGEKAAGGSYVSKNIHVPGALFFIKLAHHEGEFNVGLARRTFDSKRDQEEEGACSYTVEWFERKNKRELSWGRQPGFRLCIIKYDARRKPIFSTSVEALEDFLPIQVKLTRKGSINANEPSVSQDCMNALREYMKSSSSCGEELRSESSKADDSNESISEGSYQDEDEEESSAYSEQSDNDGAKRVRKAPKIGNQRRK